MKTSKSFKEKFLEELSRNFPEHLIQRCIEEETKDLQKVRFEYSNYITNTNKLLETICNALDIPYNIVLDLNSEKEYLKYEEKLLEKIRNKFSKNPEAPSQKVLVIHIGGEYSDTFKVDSKDYDFYEAVTTCHEFEGNDEIEEAFQDSDLLFESFKERYPNKEVTTDNINKFFKDVCEDDNISLYTFQKYLEALVPTHRMSFNDVTWL